MFLHLKPKFRYSGSIINKWTRSSSFYVWKMMFELVWCSIKCCLTHHYGFLIKIAVSLYWIVWIWCFLKSVLSRNKKRIFSPLWKCQDNRIKTFTMGGWNCSSKCQLQIGLLLHSILFQKFRTQNNLFPLKKYLTYVRKKVSKFNKVTDMDEKEIQT